MSTPEPAVAPAPAVAREPAIPGAAAAPEATDVRVKRTGTFRIATWTSLLLSLALVITFVTCSILGAPRALAAPLGHGILWSALAAFVSSILGAFQLRSADALRIEEEDLVLERNTKPRTISLRRFVEGWMSPGEGRVYLQTTRGDVYSAAVPSPAHGQAILDRAGLDAAKRTWRTRLGPVDFLTTMIWLLGGIFTIPAALSIADALRMGDKLALPLIPLIFIAQFYLVRLVFGPADLVIGADGVIVKQRLRSRFVPFEDLHSVTTAVNAVTLHLRDGSVLRARARNLDNASQTAIQERVTQALSLRRDQRAEAGAIARLDKGARTGAEWRAALSGLLVQDGDYRAARLTREQVLRVLENPGAPVGRRLGAAIALSRSQDPEVKTRARIAAAASANDRIRIAFERVAEGALDDAAIDEAAEAETSGVVAGEAG